MMDFLSDGFDLPRCEACFEVMEALYQESPSDGAMAPGAATVT